MKKIVIFIFMAIFVIITGFGWLAGPQPLLAEEIPKVNSAISDDQKSKLQNIFKNYESQIEPLMRQYTIEKATLAQTINAEKSDEAAIRAQFAKAAEVGAEVTVTNAKLRREMRAVLSKEQVDSIMKINSEMAESSIDRMLFKLATPVKSK